MRYAIEVIGYGKRRRYGVKEITRTGLILPVNGKVYRTEQAAKEAAEELGVKIAAVGDVYKISSLSN